jgi:sulfite reductase alpha subunit-like flavoprotein
VCKISTTGARLQNSHSFKQLATPKPATLKTFPESQTTKASCLAALTVPMPRYYSNNGSSSQQPQHNRMTSPIHHTVTSSYYKQIEQSKAAREKRRLEQ